jgi:hypothetical protein
MRQAITHIRELRWFESMYTLQGKTRHTQHVCFPRQSTYVTRMLPAGGPCMWHPFASHQQRCTDPTAPEKKGSWHNPQCVGWPIHGSTTQFLSQDKNLSGNESQASVGNMLHQFTGPITPACDWYIQYFLAGVNPSVLNRHMRELQSWRCRLATSHSPTFPTDGLHFPHTGPARSQVIKINQ